MGRFLNFLLVSTVFLASCHRDEIPVAPHEPGEAEIKEVTMGPLYPEQIWYDIETNTEISRNYKMDWDLGFECTEEGWHIVLNGARKMQVARTQESEIANVTDTIGAKFTWDSHTGNLDSTGIGNWKNHHHIYVLDRGQNEEGKKTEPSKIIIDSVSQSHFYFRHAPIASNTWINAQVEKDTTYMYSYFSLNGNGEQVTIAPPKTDWDICFTQYTYIYYDMVPIVPYLVTGITLNPYSAYSAQVFNKDFNDIVYEDIPKYEWKSRIDNIGWDWKLWDFDAGYYLTNPNKNFIINTQSGRMYKIHFLDWYNTQTGEKGTATFEIAEL